jgi:uncharacterized protein involved in exopolysaccharide biosynthesis
VVGALLAVLFVMTRDRTYRSETVILYHETINSADLVGGEGSAESSRRAGARLRELLLSRASLEPIITELHLYESSIVRGEMFGAVDEMRKHITFRAREGDTFEISFVGATPTEAQEVTRRLGECIIQETAARRSEKAKTLKEFLKAESVRSAAELKLKESELGRFVVLHPDFAPRLQGIAPTTAPPPGGPGAAASRRGEDPLVALLEVRALRIEKRLRAKDAPPAAPPKPVATFQPPPESAELLGARRDLAEKLARYTDKHPDVVAARNRLREAEAAQAAATQAAAAAFAQSAPGEEAAPPANATDEAALKKELADLQAQLAARRASLASGAAGTKADAGEAATLARAPGSGTVDSELEFRRLQREVSEARDQQEKLDDRLFRASIAASSVVNDRNIQVSVLDPAYLPVRPSSKPRSMLLLGLLGLCAALAVATAAVSASLDDRVYDRTDLERLDLFPVLAVIPRAPTEVRQLPPPSDAS